MNFTNRNFTNETVNLDGNSFQGCKFIRCTLTFNGTGATNHIDCDFDGPRFLFTGPAASTLAFLSTFYRAGGGEFIEEIFDDVRQGNFRKPGPLDIGAGGQN